MIFDSQWILDQAVLWPLVDQTGRQAANGIYLYAISVRDHEGNEQRKLGKLAMVSGAGSVLSLPHVSEIAQVQPAALPGGVKWQERLGKDGQDNIRIQRRPGSGQPFQSLLQLEADGKLRLSELCLGAANGAGGWTDEGAVVHLTDAADRVGLGTSSPNEQLELTGNLRLPKSTVSAGVIMSGGNRYIHNFGNNNFFAGVDAGNFTMTGSLNTGIGVGALLFNSTGTFNTGVGGSALRNNSTGSSNTAVGYAALLNTTGNDNTAVGRNAFGANNLGDSNTAMGRDALDENTNGDSNTALGFAADISNGVSNATAIGANAIVDASNKVRIGDTNVTVIQGNVAFTFSSDRNRKENFVSLDGLAVLEKLGSVPVTS